MSDAAYRKLRIDFDMDWVKVYADQRLQSSPGTATISSLSSDPPIACLYASPVSRDANPSGSTPFGPAHAMLDVLAKAAARCHARCGRRIHDA